LKALFQATWAMSRKLNRLAHNALTVSAIAKIKTVTFQHIQAALTEAGG